MKNLSCLSQKLLIPIKLLSFDCDGVVLPEGTILSQKNNSLSISTHPLPESSQNLLNKLKKKYWLNFTSGRNLVHLSQVFSPLLGDRVSLQAENGLLNYLEGQVWQSLSFSEKKLLKLRLLKKSLTELSQTLSGISGFEPKQFIITLHSQAPQAKIEELVKQSDPENELYCFYSGEAYDIGFKEITKKKGLELLLKKLKLPLSAVLVVGNDSNDQDLLKKATCSVSTDPKAVEAQFRTDKTGWQGGQELMQHLLNLS